MYGVALRAHTFAKSIGFVNNASHLQLNDENVAQNIGLLFEHWMNQLKLSQPLHIPLDKQT